MSQSLSYPFDLQGQDQPYYILNSSSLEEVIPKNFHSTKDLYRSDRLANLQAGNLKYFTMNQEVKTFCNIPSDEGLRDLNLSGSSQFTYLGFEWILDQIQRRKGQASSLINIDLREESHCFFNGVPISHYIPGNCLNFGLSNIDVVKRENQWINLLKSQPQTEVKIVLEKSDGLLKRTNTVILNNQNDQSIVSERNFIEKLQGFNYVRIPIGDHTKPTDEDMTEIYNLFLRINMSDWFHFHCAGGKGRTTTLMLLYDIFINHQRYRNLTVEDYVLRHYLIGGINLFACPVIQWKANSSLARAQLIRQFHRTFYQN